MNYLNRLIFTLFFICSLSASNEYKVPDISEDCIDSFMVAPEDIFDLQASPYIDLVTGNDYTEAIKLAINHASNLVTDPNPSGSGVGGIILFPGNTTVEISTSITLRDNITFRASHSKATITISNNFPTNTATMFAIGNKKNLVFENIIFDGASKKTALSTFLDQTIDNISFINCEFQEMLNNNRNAAAISLSNATNVTVKDCLFKTSDFGVRLDKKNHRIRIENNVFENTLTKNPIRILGVRDSVTPSIAAFSSDIWIIGNKIDIGRGDSIIEELSEHLPRDPETGAVDISAVNSPGDPGFDMYDDWREARFAPSAIYLTCGEGNTPVGIPTDNHVNVIIENNIVNGPDYGFFDGGSADLYSLKDIINLKLNNNTSRNSGDLGMSIERSSNVIVSNNTVERNNSSGIAFTDVKNPIIINNIVANNALRRDLIYNNVPYGEILILGTTTNALIEGNQLLCNSSPGDISFPINITEGIDYTRARTSPTSYYGIMIRREGTEDNGGGTSIGNPFATKIGINNYSGQRWGAIFNEVSSTQITENFAATAFPTDEDLPEGSWVGNSNLNNSALGWGVIDRNQDVLAVGITSENTIILGDASGIQVQDIIGIELPDFNVHWTTVSEINVDGNANALKILDDPTGDILNAGARVVALRWKTVTQ
ncbi:right-handed parallel beta-helix repeat-containing protein [Dokdonia sp.]|uniref:right-handed parallel beta-helix repeat-containing protein n=1 Tax=Dokdonia sp. TaxID=2024995 RepID=UPI00326596C7